MNYDLAIFDMDGTIVDSMWIWKELAHRSFTSRGVQVPESMAKDMSEMEFLDAAQYCIQQSGHEITKEQLVTEWTMEARSMYEGEVTLKSHTRELLDHLKSIGLTLCLTTANYRDVAVAVLNRFGLSSYFDSITVTEEANAGKSQPDVFLLTASKHGADPKRCIVFEDSLYAVQGAKAAGMSVVGVYDDLTKNMEDEMRQMTDVYIYSFEELEDDIRFHKLIHEERPF